MSSREDGGSAVWKDVRSPLLCSARTDLVQKIEESPEYNLLFFDRGVGRAKRAC